MEFDEHEEQDEEMEIPVHHHQLPPPPPPPTSYDSLGNSARPSGSTAIGEGGFSAAPRKSASAPLRYRECLKNHAVGIGGSAVDGCGEFMAAGEEGTLDALKCAACNCHRNFHRKETDPGEGGSGGALVNYHHPHHHHGQQHHQFSPYYRAAPAPAGYLHLTPPQQQHRPLALPAASGGGHSREELEDVSNPSSSGGGGGGGGGSGLKKRFRTKFTTEQKEKMLGFAERLGWRIQKHDEAAVEQFCAETGVRRHVLKVWMHNNKHTLGKKP